jgi:hypothetical protein
MKIKNLKFPGFLFLGGQNIATFMSTGYGLDSCLQMCRQLMQNLVWALANLATTEKK